MPLVVAKSLGIDWLLLSCWLSTLFGCCSCYCCYSPHLFVVLRVYEFSSMLIIDFLQSSRSNITPPDGFADFVLVAAALLLLHSNDKILISVVVECLDVRLCSVGTRRISTRSGKTRVRARLTCSPVASIYSPFEVETPRNNKIYHSQDLGMHRACCFSSSTAHQAQRLTRNFV